MKGNVEIQYEFMPLSAMDGCFVAHLSWLCLASGARCTMTASSSESYERAKLLALERFKNLPMSEMMEVV